MADSDNDARQALLEELVLYMEAVCEATAAELRVAKTVARLREKIARYGEAELAGLAPNERKVIEDARELIAKYGS